MHRYRSTLDDNGYGSYHYQLNEELPLENTKLISEVWVDENIDHIENFGKLKQNYFDFIFMVAQCVNENNENKQLNGMIKEW